ncbi:MAG TPA: hypothetical protein DER60_01600 [Syntrophomonas sp.]|nr:hypothetical protein [Syntrophomonas sp.]
MQYIPWFLVLFISIPQAVLVIYIGFSLCNISVDFKKSILCALLFAIATYFVRPLAIPLVLNTLILTTFLIIITGLILKIHLKKTLIACLLGIMVSGVIESLVIQVLLWIRPDIAEKLLVDAVLNIFTYIPVFLVTIAVLLVVKRFNFVLISLGELGENDEQR